MTIEEDRTGRIEALQWLITQGNGASQEAVVAFKAELEKLQQKPQQEEMC